MSFDDLFKDKWVLSGKCNFIENDDKELLHPQNKFYNDIRIYCHGIKCKVVIEVSNLLKSLLVINNNEFVKIYFKDYFSVVVILLIL